MKSMEIAMEGKPVVKKRPTLVGVVSGTKMKKTIKVDVVYYAKHPQYGKYVRKITVVKAHDEKEAAQEGDTVEIMSTRPMSKTKRWRLVRLLRRRDRAAAVQAGETGETK